MVGPSSTAPQWHAVGTWRVHPGDPSVAVIEGDRRLPALLCVISGRSASAEETTSAVIEAVAAAYGDPAPAALTTRLVQAIRAANRALLAANADVVRSERSEAALMCLAQRGDHMYLAYAGPVACYVKRLGVREPERVAPLVPAATTLPLGLQSQVEVGLATVPLVPGSVLAAAAGPLAPRLGDDGWTWLLERAEPEVVGKRLAKIAAAASLPEMTLALVAPTDERVDHGRTVPTRRASAVGPAAEARGRPVPQPRPSAEPAVTEPAALPQHHSRTVAAAALFAALALVVAATLLLGKIRGQVTELLQPTPWATVADVPAAEGVESMRTLSTRGMALDPASDAPTRPARTQATPTIQIGPLREVVHLPNGTVSDVALLGRTLIVVEGRQGRILKYLLDPFGPLPQPEALWLAGERRGTIVLGRPTHVAPLADGRAAASKIVVATDDGSFWLLTPSALSMLPPLPAQARAARLAVAPQHVFALSHAPAAVWALARQAMEQGWQRRGAAAGVRDLATDGSVYLLHEDGQITRQDDGGALPFAAFVPGEPLRAPRALATQAHARGVYVLEPSQQRVVELAKDGQFRRQFRYSAVSAPADLHLLLHDERRGWLLLAGLERIYFAPLPK